MCATDCGVHSGVGSCSEPRRRRSVWGRQRSTENRDGAGLGAREWVACGDGGYCWDAGNYVLHATARDDVVDCRFLEQLGSIFFTMKTSVETAPKKKKELFLSTLELPSVGKVLFVYFISSLPLVFHWWPIFYFCLKVGVNAYISGFSQALRSDTTVFLLLCPWSKPILHLFQRCDLRLKQKKQHPSHFLFVSLGKRQLWLCRISQMLLGVTNRELRSNSRLLCEATRVNFYFLLLCIFFFYRAICESAFFFSFFFLSLFTSFLLLCLSRKSP